MWNAKLRNLEARMEIHFRLSTTQHFIMEAAILSGMLQAGKIKDLKTEGKATMEFTFFQLKREIKRVPGWLSHPILNFG